MDFLNALPPTTKLIILLVMVAGIIFLFATRRRS